MTLNESLGIGALKICPVCGDIGPRLINRCSECEAAYRSEEKNGQRQRKRRTRKRSDGRTALTNRGIKNQTKGDNKMRTSSDEIVHGKLKNGYDYELQCWVENYIIQPCGHPENMKPDCCFSGSHVGLDIRDFYSRVTSTCKDEKKQ